MSDAITDRRSEPTRYDRSKQPSCCPDSDSICPTPNDCGEKGACFVSGKALRFAKPAAPQQATPKKPALAEGTKYDEGKPRYDLIPPEALDGLARLYALGAAKYEARNWEKGMKWGRMFAAAMRHAWAWFRGETYDPQDGQHHLLSAVWCMIALYVYHVRGVGEDDRPAGVQQDAGVWRRAA